MLFKHARCFGDLTLIVTNLFIVKAPSVGISTMGVSIEMTEFAFNDHNKDMLEFKCRKCKEQFSVTNVDAILCTCSVCGKNRKSNEVLVTEQFSSICTDCLGFLRKDVDSSTPEYIIKIKKWVELPLKMTPQKVSELLVSKISIM